MELAERYAVFESKLNRMEIARAQHLRHKSGIETEVAQLEEDIGVYQKASVVLKGLLQDMVEENLKAIDKLVTEGLRRVFHDQVDIEFKSTLVEKHNQLQISFETIQGNASGKAMDSFGASVTVVESLLLRIIVILKMGLAPVLLLDESLAQVSVHYREGLGKLIKSLCKDLDLTILLVTHQQEFQETADVVYRADATEDGKVRTLTLKCIKDTHEDPGSG